MTDQPQPLTEQQLDDYEALAARVADDPFFVSDCEGELGVWRESALKHITRDEAGEITGYCLPSVYWPTDHVIGIDLDSWDPGVYATDDQRRQDIRDLVDARAAFPALVAEVRHLRAELERRTEDLAFLERTTLPDLRRQVQHHQDGKARWRKRAETAEARVTELEQPPAIAALEQAFAAEVNDDRALTMLDALIILRSELPCTCARSQGLHEKGCRRYVAGHDLLSPARRLARAREEMQPAAARPAGAAASEETSR